MSDIHVLVAHKSHLLQSPNDELSHDLYRCHHESEVDDKENNLPLLNEPREHEIDNKSKYDYFLPSTLGIAHTPWPPEGYRCQQIDKKEWC